MQMLVYLAALVERGQQLPAGILYMPAAEPTVSAPRGMGAQAIEDEAEKSLRMNGVVLSDNEVIQAMEAGAKGQFIPAGYTKDGSLRKGSSVLDPQQMETVLKYSKKLIAAMGRELLKGAAQAQPNLKNTAACGRCPYGAVCGGEYGDKDVIKDEPAPAEALARMEREMEGGQAHG